MNKRLHLLSSLADPACQPAGLDPSLLPEIPNTINKSLAIALAWGTPPNWSIQGWADELQQTACLAALEALRDSPAKPHVALAAFLFQRVISKLRNVAQKEWGFALPLCAPTDPASTAALEQEPSPAPSPDQHAFRRELLIQVSALPPQSRSLLVSLFWLGSTEVKEAKALGVTQSAINQRKRATVLALRRSLSETGAPQPTAKSKMNHPHYPVCKLAGSTYKNPNPRNTTYRKTVDGMPLTALTPGPANNPSTVSL